MKEIGFAIAVGQQIDVHLDAAFSVVGAETHAVPDDDGADEDEDRAAAP